MWWDDYFIVASSAVAFAVTIGAEISESGFNSMLAGCVG